MSDKIYSLISQRGGREVFGFSSMTALNRLHQLIREYEVRSVIEIGSFVGMSAIFFADVGNVGSITCIDPFDAPKDIKHPNGRYYDDDHYREFLANTMPYVNIRHLRMRSGEAEELVGEADMVYTDGDHSYDAVVSDVLAYAPHARHVLCGDDNVKHKFGVNKAITDLGIPDSEERIWWLAGGDLEKWKTGWKEKGF